MSPRKQKILFSKGIGSWIVLTNSDWSAIEKQYKHKIPIGVRVRITLVTIWFTKLHPAAMASPRIKTILPKVKRLQKAARSLVIDLIDPKTGRPESDLRLISDLCFVTPQQLAATMPFIEFELLAHWVNEIDRLCEQIIKTVSQPDYSGFEKFRVWNFWVAMVSLIVNSANLPSKIRKDIDKQSRPSQFVILISQIQKRLPEAARRKLSDDSLAQAIVRARNEIGFGDVSADALDTLILLVVGAFNLFRIEGGWALKRNKEIWGRLEELITDPRVRMNITASPFVPR